PPVDEIETSIAAAEERQVAPRGEPVDNTAVATRIAEIIAELACEEGIAFQSASAQYQTFLTRCRRERLIGPMPDMRAFRRRFAVAG
ncbi:MAG TPA: ATP-binding protein, partial [Erythrobacter sp.]|nr:ATP-binding protein [Erythrobacter sp.]